MTIQVTFPKSFSPDYIKKVMEGNLKKNSSYTCTVDYKGIEDGESVYDISSELAEAFYLIGITAGQILRRAEK